MKSKLIFLLQSYMWFLFLFIFVSVPALMGGAHFSPLLRVLPFFLVPSGMLHLLMLFTSKSNEGLQDFAKALNKATWFSFVAMTCFSVIKVLHNLDDSPSWISGILTPLPSFFLWTLLFSVALFVSARSVDNNAKLEQDFFPEAKQRLNIMVQSVGYAFGVLFFASVLCWIVAITYDGVTARKRTSPELQREVYAEMYAHDKAEEEEVKYIKQKCAPMPSSLKKQIEKQAFDAEMAKPLPSPQASVSASVGTSVAASVATRPAGRGAKPAVKPAASSANTNDMKSNSEGK